MIHPDGFYLFYIGKSPICFMQNISQISPVVLEKKLSEWFLPSMGMTAILNFRSLLFLAWAWPAKPKAKVIIPKSQPLPKHLRKTPSKSAKYHLQCIPLRQKLKRPLKIKICLGLNLIIRFKFTTLFDRCAMLIVSNCSTINSES